jgi:hypothetical protein
MTINYCQLFGFGAILLLSIDATAADWAPIIAKHRETTSRIGTDGSETLLQERRGSFLRASNGSSLLTKRSVMNGLETADESAGLTDATTGKVFALSYKTGTAILRRQRELPIRPRKLDPATFSGEQIINGMRCVGRKVVCQDPHLGRATECGTAWYSPEYDLTIRIESDETVKGQKIRSVFEHYDVQVGTEPDASLFRIPNGFKIVTEPMRKPSQCPRCQ